MKMKNPLLVKVLRKIAPRIGARIVLEPTWGIVGQIVYRSGQKRYFRFSTLDLNRMGASDIARDKDYAKFFLKKGGYRVIPGKAFCSSAWAKQIGSKEDPKAALAYAKSIGWPVIVKPNSSSQGRGVTKVHSAREFAQTFRAVAQTDKMVLVEKFIEGHDYRIVVLDNKVISAYERIPLFVVGWNNKTIRELLAEKQKEFIKSGRDTVIKPKDPRMKAKLAHDGMSLSYRPFDGEKVFLLDNANLSSGGDSFDVTSIMPESVKNLAINMTRDMGLRLCGVDIMLKQPAGCGTMEYHVIEINSAPGLDHYASIGAEQEKIVEDMYLEVLKAMEK
jgi:D-alanine-D-alanine ligase-like ATP-grasp enzyme